MKVTSCYYHEGHMNQCACAIAVRASSDIYVIDRCPETVPSFFGFKSCVEDLLHVVKKSTDERKYEVSTKLRYTTYLLKMYLYNINKDR